MLPSHAGPHLEGILHAGGVLRDELIANQTAAGMRAVFAPKAAGTRNLLRCSERAPLGAVQLFSSVAACLGSGGQANYAAANAAMDCMAHRQQVQACVQTALPVARPS